MALITCPECEKENVSGSAAFCPECGYRMKKQFKKITFSRKQEADGIGNTSNIGNIGGFSDKKYKIIAIIIGIMLVVFLCLFGLYRKTTHMIENEIYNAFDEADDIVKTSVKDSLYDLVYNTIGMEENDKMNVLIDKNVEAAMDAINAGRSMEISDVKLGFSECTVEVSTSNASLDSGIKDIVMNCLSGSFGLSDIFGALSDSYSKDPYQYVDNLFNKIWTSLKENRQNAPKITAKETIKIKKEDGEWQIVNEDSLQKLVNAYSGISSFDQGILDSLNEYMTDSPDNTENESAEDGNR